MTRSLRGSLAWLALAIFAGLAGGATQAQAQNAVITGRVNSEQGQPLFGANVYIAELNISVGTNEAGSYNINIPAPRVQGQSVHLRARMVGFAPQDTVITVSAGTQTINFTMRLDPTRLAEVVVTGVSQATEQIRVPFTVAHVDSTLMPVAGTSAIAQLQGKVPGATIVSASGRPGSAPSVILRGPVSINAEGRSQSPAYLVDGVLIQGDVPDINPEDIENVEIVKGAAAASIYGSDAGAGIIQITTKRGKNAAEGVRFGVRAEMGASDIEGEFPLAKFSTLHTDPTGHLFCSTDVVGGSSCGRLIDMDEEMARVNDNLEDFALPPQLFLGDGGIAGVPKIPTDYAWLTGTFQTTPYPKTYDVVRRLTTPQTFLNTTVDARGRVGETGFYASLGRSEQQGAVRFVDGYSRNSARLNVDQSVSDKLSLSLSTYYAQTRDAGTDGGNTWFRITRLPAFADPLRRDSQGRLYIRNNVLNQGEQNNNPAYPAENDIQVAQGGRFIGSLTGRYTPLTWLTVDGTFGYDRSQTRRLDMNDRGFRSTTDDPDTNLGFIQNRSGDDRAINASLAATTNFMPVSDLETTVAARILWRQEDSESQSGSGDQLVVPGLNDADAAITNFSITSGTSNVRSLAYLGTLDLVYKGRYILSGSLRRDGSSLFGEGHRWATFGRAAAAWIGSEEPWWPLSDAVSLFKLHASYGTSGQAPNFSAQYTTYSLGAGGQLVPNTLGNPELRPEVNHEIEAGVDAEFFGRLALNVTYSHARITDQILPVKQPSSAGFSEQWQNVGTLEGNSWEATLSMPVITRPTFSYSTRLIWDHTVSKITQLNVLPFTSDITAGNTFTVFRFREGEKIGTFYGTDYVRSCSQLPDPFASQCGGPGSAFQKNSDGYIVWVGEGNSLSDGITRNLWTSYLPKDQAPWQSQAGWGLPIVLRNDTTLAPESVPLGNSVPDFHLGWSNTVTWKKFSFYALVDATIGNEVWNTNLHWSLGDFMTALEDQAGKSVADAKPAGYYWRRGKNVAVGGSSGVGGFYDVLGPTRFSVESGSFVKLREVSVNYRIGPVGGVGDWNLGLVGRNLHTWTDFRGWDPEVGVSGGVLNSAALNAVSGFDFPNLRTFTVQLSTNF